MSKSARSVLVVKPCLVKKATRVSVRALVLVLAKAVLRAVSLVVTRLQGLSLTIVNET